MFTVSYHLNQFQLRVRKQSSGSSHFRVLCVSPMRPESIQNNDDDDDWDDDGDDDDDCADDDDDESQSNHQCYWLNSMLLFATTSIAHTRVPDKRRNMVHCFAEI